MGRVVLLLSVVCVIYPFDGYAEIVSVDDPRLIAIREHILKAYYLRPEPVDQCSEKVCRFFNLNVSSICIIKCSMGSNLISCDCFCYVVFVATSCCS